VSALSDVKVLDLTRLLPGGFCSLLLADLGAEVLKVEDTGMGDYIRWAPPYYGTDEQQELGTRSALYLSLNRGKRSVRLDLKSEAGREALLRLVESHDVVLDGFRPGVLDRLGVGYERMREANPAIVFCAITGYGQDGPYAQRAGHDMNYLGLIGLLGLTGAAISATTRCHSAASSSSPAACSVTCPTRRATAGSAAARSSRSSGPPSATGSSVPT
jgi:crotonobetainyl-CoA:carnitine CoA-transferase CaiB-like acyl-CoA transferase